MNSSDLLAEFRKTRVEAAFSALVRHYTNLVYSAARRRLNNDSLAEEATQNVFIRLAKSLPNLRTDAELAAWLHRTTINASIDLWRSESRRRAREEQAAAMQPAMTENAEWNEVAPIVDEALNELNDADRELLLLRYFERTSMRDLGHTLGITEDAAKMRVSRAVEHLRAACGKRGAVCGAGVLVALLTERAVTAASASLVLTLASLPIPAVAVAGTAGGLLTPPLKAMLAVGAAAIVVTMALIWERPGHDGGQFQAADQAKSESNPPAQANSEAASAVADATTNADVKEPDPIELLMGVALARNRIRSGEMEFDVVNYNPAHASKATNYVKLKARFDGIQRRVEIFDREYSYTEVANDDTNIQAQAEQMTCDQAVEAGFSKPFDSHRVIAYDGSRLFDYWENQGQVDVKKPEGTGQFAFDPRCLGISSVGFVSDTIEGCLDYDHADSVELAGEESVEGVPAWRVRVRRNSMDTDFWLEKEHPSRVLKCSFNGDFVEAKYDDANRDDPIPIETTMSSPQFTARGAKYFLVRRITRRNARFNIPVDPASWTLAGLDMKTGTTVADDRLMRRIGYWNGSGLSEDAPGKAAEPQVTNDPAKLLALIDNEPFLPEALDAAQWIISNMPDGPEVDLAAEVILDNHIDNPNLVPLCQELERLRPGCSQKLLEALLEKSPSLDVRGNACLALATLRGAEANYGANQRKTIEAEKLYERVIAEFGEVKSKGTALRDLAKPELYDLRQLSIGRSAPPAEGMDLEGRPLKLSDYRGQVVLLIFWGECGGCRPEVPTLLKLLDRYNGKPFAIIGVYCDDDAVEGKAIADELGMTWTSFRDNRNGPISRIWNIAGWPHIDLIDAKGIIRYRNVFRTEAPAAVDALMKE